MPFGLAHGCLIVIIITIVENSVTVFEVQLSHAYSLAVKHVASFARACLSLSVWSVLTFLAHGKYII